jgi:hypothetical protein
MHARQDHALGVEASLDRTVKSWQESHDLTRGILMRRGPSSATTGTGKQYL